MEILSNADIENIRTMVTDFQKEAKTIQDDLNTLTKNFESNEIIQSFYKSGKFGKEEEDKIIKIKKGVDKYIEVTDKLCSQTHEYLDNDYMLNQTGGMS